MSRNLCWTCVPFFQKAGEGWRNLRPSKQVELSAATSVQNRAQKAIGLNSMIQEALQKLEVGLDTASWRHDTLTLRCPESCARI